MNLFRRNCRRYADRMSDYLEGELSGEWAVRIEEHVQACPLCDGELRELRGVLQLTRSLPTHQAPRSFRLEPAMVRPPREIPVEQAPAGSGGFNLFRRPELAMRYGAAVASVALLAVLVTDLSGSDSSPETAADPAAMELAAPADDGALPAEESGSTLAQEAPKSEAGDGDAEDSAALAAPDAERSAGEAQPVTVLVEEDGRSDALLAAEIGLAAAALAAVGASIYWARRRA